MSNMGIERLQKLSKRDRARIISSMGIMAAVVLALFLVVGGIMPNMAAGMAVFAPLVLAVFACGGFFVLRMVKKMERDSFDEGMYVVMESVPMVCSLYDMNNNIKYCNDKAPKLFGFKDREEYSSNYASSFPEFQPDGTRTGDLEANTIHEIKTTGSTTVNWYQKASNGELLPLHLTMVRAHFQGEYHMLEFTRDRRQELELQRQEELEKERMQSILDASPQLCIVTDEEGTILDVNKEAEKMFGIPDKQMFVKNYGSFVPEYQADGSNSLQKTTEMARETIRNGHCRYEFMYKRKDGTPLPAEEIVTRITVGGKNLAICYSRDLREFYANKEKDALVQQSIQNMAVAREASKAKSNFLAKMSHEIRTPMNAVIGMAELALREKDPPTVRAHVLTIKQAGTNLLSIINDILDFTKIESGKLEITPDYYQFSSLMNDVISIIRMRAIDSRLHFAVHIDANIPNELYGDAARIRQILINVLGNAVKYTEKGFVNVTVTGELSAAQTVNLIIDVEDSGRGIKKENLNKLFTDFVQLDTAKNKHIEGAGLGLAITWNILKAMDGDIQVFSEYGKGSKFTIALPQKFRSSERLAQVQSPKEKSVLIYEHREVYAHSIAATLANLGVHGEIVSDDTGFCARLAETAYPFVFIAHTLYEQCKDKIPGLNNRTKIVLLTEFGETSAPKDRCSILAMPVHCISVANILNGFSEEYSYKEGSNALNSFSAPQARVLVVDDMNTNLMVAEGLLMTYGMQVDLCKSGAEALMAVQSRHYDLIFMDHWMPEMDGVEAAKQIRSLNGYCGNIPIIALTANAISGIQDMFMENGMNGFLAKPIDTVKLNSVLEQWIPKEKRKSPTKRKKVMEEYNEFR